jgi:hypothetical protein
MIEIHADWNSRDEDGSFWLSLAGSMPDIERHGDVIQPGLRVLLTDHQELTVEAVLEFDRIWLGVPDEDTLRYLDDVVPDNED